MTVTADDLTTAFPEFASTDDEVIEAAIERAERRTNRAAWGVKADDGVILLACHMLAMNARSAGGSSSPAGVLASETVGPLSRTYAAPTGTLSTGDAWIGATIYGQAYLELRGLVFAPRVA